MPDSRTARIADQLDTMRATARQEGYLQGYEAGWQEAFVPAVNAYRARYVEDFSVPPEEMAALVGTMWVVLSDSLVALTHGDADLAASLLSNLQDRLTVGEE